MTIYDTLLLMPMALVVVGLWIDLLTHWKSDNVLFRDVSKSNNKR